MSGFGFQWHISDRCNRRCAHCYQERFDAGRTAPPELRRAMADDIFTTLSEGSVTVNLTGGEPLIDPDLFDLIDHLAGFDALRAVNIITNGTVLDPGLIARLADRPAIAEIKISLESGLAAADDAIRGGGHLARLRANLPGFRSTGKPLTAMLTLGRHNLADLEPTVDWVRDQGFRSLIIERFVPLGRGAAMADQVLGSTDWARLQEALISRCDPSLTPIDLRPYRAFRLAFSSAERPTLAGALCDLGPHSMALMPDGTVYPCRRLPLAVGRLPEEPFARIRRRLADWAVRATRPRLTGAQCGPCPEPECAGCRALAMASTGDPWADDPCCAPRP